MLCEREARHGDKSLDWRLPVFMMALAVAVGALVAAYL